MTAAKLSLEFKGMVTAPGQLAAPPGSLTVAQNVDFPAIGLAEKRRGVQAAPFGFGGAAWSVISTKQLGSNLLFNVGDGSGATSLQYGTGLVARTVLSTPDATNVTNTPATRMKAAVSLKNHYLTSTRAPLRLQSDLTLKFAGMPRSPGVAQKQQGVAQLVAGTTQWLANNYAVAYRTVWVTTDSDGVDLVSAPSGRWVITNVAGTNGFTGAARDTSLHLRIPFQADTVGTPITTSWRVRVYRSIAVDSTTAQPNDEMQLCFESSPTAGDITAGEMTITDSCPEAALGAYLYTNTVSGGDVSTGLVRSSSTSLGLLASNDRPPLAKDVAIFANCAWWANFTTLPRLTFSILAVGAAGNVLKAGDTITISDLSGSATVTAVGGAVPAANQFRVETALGSTTLNIRQTAMNLVATINQNFGGQVATYIGSDASPGTIGQIMIEGIRSDANNGNFTLAISAGSTLPYLPQLTSGITSGYDTWGNGIAISKPFQADAVAPANYVRVGRNDTTIQRVIPLRDALFIFTDDGIFWARGNSPADFQIDSFDTTFRLQARDTAVACGDAIYAWGLEGIARITNGGVEYLDIPIRNYVTAAVAGLRSPVTLAAFAQRAFAVSYRVARKVVFFFPYGIETGDYACNNALVFAVPTESWSTYIYRTSAGGAGGAANGKLSGAVRVSDELMFLGEWSAGTDTLLYVEGNAKDTTDFHDTSSASVSIAIDTVLEWTSTVPSPAGLCHWPEAQVYFSPSDVNKFYTLPTSVMVGVESEHGGTFSATITAPSTLQSRLMLSADVGMAARQTMTVQHNTIDDYFSLSGFALLYHPVSNFIGR